MSRIIFILAVLVTTQSSHAKSDSKATPVKSGPAAVANEETTDAKTAETHRTFQFVPQVATVFPTFIGGGAAVALFDTYEMNFLYGVTPKLYHETIANVAADMATRPSYEGIVNTAFDNNSLIRSAFLYNFKAARQGWNAGFAFSLLKADGIAQLKDVDESSDSSGLAALIALLIGSGEDPTIQLKSELFIAELNFGYKWLIAKKFSLGASLGVAKVLSAKMDLSTALPNYDSSDEGEKTLGEAENDLEDVVVDYGITPTLGLSIAYGF